MKSPKPIISLIAILVVVIITGLYIQTPKETIKIGFIGPLTGGPALWGQGSLNMINLAVDEINAQGGVNGRRLQVIAEDGKCQPQPATTAAQKLIQVDGVKFILGGHCSPETGAIAPIAQENKVFALAGVSTATDLVSNFDYVFRTSPPNLDQAKLIAEVALNKYGLRSIATLTEQTTFAKSITDDFVKAFQDLGGSIVTQEEFAPGQADFRTELSKIKEKELDAVFVSPQSPTSGIVIVKQINELGINTSLLGNTVFISKQVYTESQGALPSEAFSVAPYVDPQSDGASKLISKYKQKYGQDVPYNLLFVGAAYDGVYMLKDALQGCGEDATCVRDYFYGFRNWPGAVAGFSFDRDGDPILKSWKEIRIVDGVEVFETVSG